MPDFVETVFHEATPATPPIWHYETVKSYANGGRDVRRVIDAPGQPAVAAHWEKEEILRYVPYTEEELAKREMESSQEDLLEALEQLISANSIASLMSTLLSIADKMRPTLERRALAREKLSGRKKDG